MKKERIFYLDFIRALSTLIIVLCHYNALYIYSVNNPGAILITGEIGSVYIGDFGVSLFLILSGASLMVSYGKKESVDWKQFYWKRIRTIYPMYWVGFLGVFAYDFYVNACVPGAPKYSIIWTILGLDGYIGNLGIPTFFVVGEWFLGFIILVYIVFPVLLYLIKKAPKLLAAVVLAVYVCTLMFYEGTMPIMFILTTRLPEILFGMYLIQSGKKVSWKVALTAPAIIVLNSVIDVNHINFSLRTTYIGISAYLVLAYIAQFFEIPFVKRICSVLCKYSYACVIIHHTVIYRLSAKFDIANISLGNSFMLFVCCCITITIASWLLYHVTSRIEEVIFGEN